MISAASARGRFFLESFNPDQADIELVETDGASQDQRYAVMPNSPFDPLDG